MKISVTILTIILTLSFAPTNLFAETNDKLASINQLQSTSKKEQKFNEQETNIGIPIPTGNGGGKFPPDEAAYFTITKSALALLCKIGVC